MNTLAKWLILAAAFAALGTTVYIQKINLDAEKLRADTAEKSVSDRDAIIEKINETAAGNSKALNKLQADRDHIRSTLSNREIQIRNLQNENAEIRNWADIPVPAAIASMRQHPAITGADAYHQRLSGSDPLHASRNVAPD